MNKNKQRKLFGNSIYVRKTYRHIKHAEWRDNEKAETLQEGGKCGGFASGLADSLVNNTIYQIEIIKEECSQGFY